MTIKQAQEIYFVATSKDDDIDKSINMVAAYTGKTPEQVEQMSIKKFNRYCIKISKVLDLIGRQQFNGKPAKYVWVGTRLYRLTYDVQKIQAGMYVEAVTFGKDMVGNMHKILASMATRVNWRGKDVKMIHQDKAKDMERVDFSVAYHAAVFFFLFYEACMKATQPYLIREMMKAGITEVAAKQSLNDLWKVLDGWPMPKWYQSTKAYLSMRFGI